MNKKRVTFEVDSFTHRTNLFISSVRNKHLEGRKACHGKFELFTATRKVSYEIISTLGVEKHGT